jgi:hypothetical protein
MLGDQSCFINTLMTCLEDEEEEMVTWFNSLVCSYILVIESDHWFNHLSILVFARMNMILLSLTNKFKHSYYSASSSAQHYTRIRSESEGKRLKAKRRHVFVVMYLFSCWDMYFCHVENVACCRTCIFV